MYFHILYKNKRNTLYKTVWSSGQLAHCTHCTSLSQQQLKWIFTRKQHREVGKSARPTEVVGGAFDVEHGAWSRRRRHGNTGPGRARGRGRRGAALPQPAQSHTIAANLYLEPRKK